VIEFIRKGVIPKGARKNLDFSIKDVTFRKNLAEEEKLALSDPQTSGGMLISLPRKGLKTFERIFNKARLPYWIIGEVKRGRGKILIQ
jgi:selenide,water dikinase